MGPVNGVALAMGLISEPYDFSNTDLSVWFGMVTNYLPFMVLPLYVALEKFDFSLIEAARDLGASSFQILIRILFPLTKPGIVTGLIFVFTPAKIVRDIVYMGVYSQAGTSVFCDEHVCCFSPNSRKFYQLIYVVWNFSPIKLD